MSKKIIVFLGLVVIIFIIIGTSILILSQQKNSSKLINPISNLPFGTEEQAKTLTYEDESGFSFDYPSTLGVYEKEIPDPTYYSEVELSSKKYPNKKFLIKIFDTTSTTVEKWLEKNSQLGSLLSKSNIVVDGMKGLSLQYGNPDRNLTLILDSGILYYFEYPKGEKFWEDAGKLVTSSFKLVETTSTADSTSSIIDEGEELVY